MNKKIYILLFSLFLSTLMFSQKNNKESWKKIKALKVAYLTEQLNLMSDEAEKFWPLYNEFDKKQGKLRNSSRMKLRKMIREKGDIEAITDEEAKGLITFKLSNDKALYELQSEFVKKVGKIISHQKILKLQLAEMEFARKLMKKYRKKQKEK